VSITCEVVALGAPARTLLPMEAATAPLGFGELLRSWRRRRRLSQLELSLDSDVSARHLSFVETGRSRPSREMVVRLAETLEIPLRERNALLLAAGYAPAYSERPLSDEEMQPARSAIDRFLRAHEPYPALVVDRWHDIVAANDALGSLTTGCADWLLAPAPNAIRIALHPEGVAPRIRNFDEWSEHLISGLRREAALTGDRRLEELLAEVEAYPGVRAGDGRAPGAPSLFVPLRIADGEEELAFVSTIATFGTAVDITLAELSVEAFYPANARTATRLLEEIGA
jgi:transcriptional regulator with XRE-family HTH domain